jgi:hypothetical protein
MRKLLLASALLVLPALSVYAADNPWVGTWKLDLAKSNFTGDTFTYTQAEKGLFHFSDGSAISYDFGIDGKEYPTPLGYTDIWTAGGNNSWDTVVKLKGTIVDNVHRQLSADGKTLTITETGTKPDGSSFHDEEVYNRVGKGQGLIGKWKSSKVNISAPNTFLVAAPAEGVLRWEIPEYKETVKGKSDGSDLPIAGPTVPEGLTISIKMLADKKLTYTVKMSGKPISVAIQTLSSDGKTMTEVDWSPGKESEKSTAVYLKQ